MTSYQKVSIELRTKDGEKIHYVLHKTKCEVCGHLIKVFVARNKFKEEKK